MSKNKQRTG